MLQTLSIPIELPASALELLKLGQEIFNEYATWAAENKTWSKRKAHIDLYQKHREKYPQMPSGLLQAIRDNALEACKRDRCKTKPKKKRLSLRYDKRTLTLRGQQLTLAGLDGRMKVILQIPEFFKERANSWELKGGTLIYRKNRFWIKLTYFKETPELIPDTEVIGIDRGIYHAAVTSAGTFYSSSKVRASQRRYLNNRKTLQAKGTHSSKRRLKAMSGKEKRFSRDVNHVVSKQIANSGGTTFVLENLKGIRKQRKGKTLNKRVSSWAFSQFALFLQYKTEALGKRVVYTDPRYTSQKCSKCKSRHDTHRSKSRFRCATCGNKMHSDLNAAINIRDNFLISLLPRTEGQGAVNHPNVSDRCLVTEASI